MPVMPRLKSKATKIAYKIMGIPNNIRNRKHPWNKQVNERLIFEDTSRIR